MGHHEVVASMQAQIDALKAELFRTRARLRAAVKEGEDLTRKNYELRIQRFVRFNEEECWIYQGDGEDQLDSLVCPVVIAPMVLKGLEADAALLAELPSRLVEAAPHSDSGDIWDDEQCAAWIRSQIDNA